MEDRRRWFRPVRRAGMGDIMVELGGTTREKTESKVRTEGAPRGKSPARQPLAALPCATVYHSVPA